MTPLLYDDLRRDEGLRLRAYQDTLGNWTIGYGHAGCSPTAVWTLDQAESQLRFDVTNAVRDLDEALPWWRGLNDVRQDVMVELTFNMGVGRLLGFTDTLAALKAGNFVLGARDLLLSRWASQVHERAQRLDFMMLNGARPA